MNNVPDVFRPLLDAICTPQRITCPRCGGHGYLEYEVAVDECCTTTKTALCPRCDGLSYLNQGDEHQ